MLRNRTVNLVKLSAEASGGTTSESLYRRFQNFFLRFAMPPEDVGRLILSKLPKPADGWTLSMDRTNWKFRKLHISIRTGTPRLHADHPRKGAWTHSPGRRRFQ